MKPVFVDSSYFKALLDLKDDFHPQAQVLFSQFAASQTIFITTNYIIDESLTLMRNKGNVALALKLRDFIHDNRAITIIRVTVKDEANAWEWFEKPWSKLSFTDCVSFAVMKRLGLVDVATFDNHFAKVGFTMLRS